jgi:hypothetical protein
MFACMIRRTSVFACGTDNRQKQKIALRTCSEVAMPGTNRIVFRDTAKEIPDAELSSRLRRSVFRFMHSEQEEDLIDALLLRGQLECAPSESDSRSRDMAESITNCLATRLLESQQDENPFRVSLAAFENSALPGQLPISAAEG